MKEKLEAQDWICVTCGCPGRGKYGFDCAKKGYPGYVIQLFKSTFRLIKNGLVIESDHAYKIEDVLKNHNL